MQFKSPLFAQKINVLPTQSEECNQVHLLLGKINTPHNHTAVSIADFNKDEEKRLSQIDSIAEKLFINYISEKINSDFLESFENCYESNDLDLISLSVNNFFYYESLRLIEKWGLISKKFIKSVRSQDPLFRICGLTKDDIPQVPLMAAFHRGKESVYMNIRNVPPRDWFLILIHELAHSTDQILRQNVLYSGDFENVGEIKNIILKSQKDPKLQKTDLSEAQQKIFHQWCLASFERGILSEIRAWTITSLLYLEGIDQNKISPIYWMDDYFFNGLKTSHRKEFEKFNTTFSLKVFHRLEPKFYNTFEGVFSFPIFENEINAISHELKLHPESYLDFDENFKALMNKN